MTMKHYLKATPAEGAALAKSAAELLLSKPKTTNAASVSQMSPETNVPEISPRGRKMRVA
jgi:hypothetical protein